VDEVIGDFRGKRTAIVLDDMVSGGGTVSSVVRVLVQKKGIQEVHLAASHNLCLGQAHRRLVALSERFHLQSFVATNSIPQTDRFQTLGFFSWRCLSEMLSETIGRIHHNLSVSEAFYRPQNGTRRERS
jgi:phosphoribosylpyrophosphate synthetase